MVYNIVMETFYDNLKNGDTGTSHFAFSLNRGPFKLIYNNGVAPINLLPFYLTQGKGELRTYWLNHYNTNWN